MDDFSTKNMTVICREYLHQRCSKCNHINKVQICPRDENQVCQNCGIELNDLIKPGERHVDGGSRCLVGHAPGEGQCIKCIKCRDWIKPKDFNTTKCSIVTDYEMSDVFNLFEPILFYVKNHKTFCVEVNGNQIHESHLMIIKFMIQYLERVYNKLSNKDNE